MTRKERPRVVARRETGAGAAAWWLGLGVGLALLVPQLALGQATVPADPAPPGSPETIPEEVDPGPPIGSTRGQGSLGEELGRTGGVIVPPRVGDPGIVEEPPPAELFPTPVIPPANGPPPAAPTPR